MFCVLFFLGYLFADMYNCVVNIQDNSKGAMQNYIHHLVGFGGCFSTIICGRMICTLSSFTCLTEISTPFVSLRWLLATHKMSSTTLYKVNGLLMTSSFFVWRCILQTYVVLWLLVPAVKDRSQVMMAECS